MRDAADRTEHQHEPGTEVPIATRAVRGSFYTIGASAITLTLGLLRSILLARLLLPEHFGVVALALFYIGLASQLRGLGLNVALIHRQDVDEPVLRTYFSLRMGLDAVIFGLLLTLTPFLQRLYPQIPGLSTVLATLIPITFTSNLSQLQETLIRKNLAFSQLAAIDIAASVTMTIVAPLTAWLGWGVWALVVERFSGIGMRFLLTWGVFRQWTPRFGWEKQVAQWFWKYGKSVWVGSNLGYLLDRFDDFWIGTTLGKTPLGYYSRAYEFARYPRRIIANPLVNVLTPVFARLQKDRIRLSQAFYRASHVVLRTGFLISGAFALVMPEFIHLIIGDKWLPMLLPFRLMLIYTLLDALLMLCEKLLLAVGRPQGVQHARLIQILFFIPAVVIGTHLWGINGVALAADGMLTVGAWILYHKIGEVVSFSLFQLSFWPSIALAMAWLAGRGVEGFWHPGTLWLMAGGKLILFSGLYLALLLITERGNYMRGLRWVWESIKVDNKR